MRLFQLAHFVVIPTRSATVYGSQIDDISAGPLPVDRAVVSEAFTLSISEVRCNNLSMGPRRAPIPANNCATKFEDDRQYLSST